MKNLEELLKESRKRIRHLERSRDRARRRLKKLQKFIIGSTDIVSLRDSMATSMFKEIERKMGKAMLEIVQNDQAKRALLQHARVTLEELSRGQYMFHMTRLCRSLSRLYGDERADVLGFIKSIKDEVLMKRYGKVTIGTRQLTAAFEAFHSLREARNESAHLFERLMKDSHLPNRQRTQKVFLKDMKRALRKREVSDRLKDMAPLLEMEVERWLFSYS